MHWLLNYFALIAGVACLKSTGARSENQLLPQLSQSPEVLGVRIEHDRASITDEGVNAFQADSQVVLRLFGNHLENTSITFTSHPSAPKSLCDDYSRLDRYALLKVDVGVAKTPISLPEGKYYICVKQDGHSDWFHLGTAPWVTIEAQGQFLPVSLQIALLISLLALSGLFSGLNLGLMALDQNDLKVIASCGTEDEKRYAKTIQPIRSRGNFLLCSLLLGNVLVNSSLTILLDGLTSGLIAVIASTISIVIFGEIIPQAICSRHGLAVGAKTILIPYLFMLLTFPMSWPISKVLDYLLGDEIGNVYDRERLMEYIRITKDYNKLEAEEVNIISGALGLKKKMVGEVMTRLEDVFALPLNANLDFQTVSEIQRRGYSRIPVFDGERKNIVALFHAKDLAFVDPEDAILLKTVLDFYSHPLIHTYEDTTLDVVLEDFKQGKSHMAFVRNIYDTGEGDPYYEITGVVTLEDVIEEILQSEIVDETDIISDNRKKQRRKMVIRQDFSDFAKIGEGEQGVTIISPQLALATFQFLCTSIEPFSKQFISETVLRRLLTQKIYFQCKVDDTQIETGKYNSLGNTDQRMLYISGKAADYFIMILEGRVRVTVGKEDLIFESGPFSHFGLAALKPPLPGEGYGVTSNASSRHSVSSTNINIEPRPLTPEPKSPSNFVQSQPSDSVASTINAAPTAVSSFTSDYTVKVMETTLYLKIPRRVYLAAYRATLMERQRANVSPDNDEDDGYVKELDKAFRSHSAQGMNRQRSFPALNHRESIVPPPAGGTRSRKQSRDTLRDNRQLSVQFNASHSPTSNGRLRFDSEDGTKPEDGRPDDTRISFSQSLGHSPSPSFDEHVKKSQDDKPSPGGSPPGTPNEKTTLM
ncbi:Metal transporter CNNM4 [Halotydeus destructor]|nr:Metal transporter CNNM4 [Halotydeus destructor]